MAKSYNHESIECSDVIVNHNRVVLHFPLRTHEAKFGRQNSSGGGASASHRWKAEKRTVGFGIIAIIYALGDELPADSCSD